MKTFKSSLVVITALLFISGRAMADDTDTSISVRHTQKEKQTLVRVCNFSPGKAILRLKDEAGRVLHREAINGHSYMKKYDMASLPSGEYTVEVRSEEGVSREVFTIGAGTPTAVYFKPAVQVEEDLVKVMFKNSIASPVSLTLHDRFGEVLYQTTVASQEQFSKGLSLARLTGEQYSLSITGDNYVYSKSIALK